MSDWYCAATFPYYHTIMRMARDMFASCRKCPLEPCGEKRVPHKCRAKIEQYYSVPGTKDQEQP
jgi:hypothetical protein